MDTSREFGAMLDELLAAEEAEAAGAARVSAVDYLSAIEELHSGRIVIADDVTAQYRETAAEPVADLALPAAPPLLPSLDPADIELELGLKGTRDPHEIDALRRRFAFANHPDRVAPELREHALQRMQIANMLADAAKRACGARR